MRAALGLSVVVLLAGMAAPTAAAENAAARNAVDSVDEIHWSFGDAPTELTLSWRGDETVVAYGLTDAYGSLARGAPSAVTPVDRDGPFREAELTGLAPDTVYHYRIGEDGADHTLRTAPLGSFRWVDTGDTASSLCKPWATQVHALIAQLAPRFVTHGGDISEANVCGVGAVHQYYLDQQAWSMAAAFQPMWGNHEYGQPHPSAPAGTPRDTLANYKGRSAITNPQTISVDTATKTSHPGCPGGPDGGNGCRGEDWGWFRAGGVLFVGSPEIWPEALADWRRTAEALLAEAQADPTIDFVVTYGHRPAYSSQVANGWDPAVRAAVDALAARFSPRPDNPAGKYVLNLGHHVHALEAFRPINGLTHVTNASGGQGRVTLPSPPDPNSLLRLSHLGVLAGEYDAAARALSLRWVCGPDIPGSTGADPCGYGDTMWSATFRAAGTDPDPTPTVSPSVCGDIALVHSSGKL